MEARLRLELNEAVDAAFTAWRKEEAKTGPRMGPGGTKMGPKMGPGIAKTGPICTQTESDTLSRVTILVGRKLRKRSLWGKVQNAIVEDFIGQMVRTKMRTYPEPNEEQLALPGFEHLPKTLGAGKYRVRLPQVTISRFLVYEARYQGSTERNQKVADNLQRLAELVRPLLKTDPDMLLGEAVRRIQVESPKLATGLAGIG